MSFMSGGLGAISATVPLGIMVIGVGGMGLGVRAVRTAAGIQGQREDMVLGRVSASHAIAHATRASLLCCRLKNERTRGTDTSPLPSLLLLSQQSSGSGLSAARDF